MIRINDIHKSYFINGKRTRVLKGITTHIKRGEKVVVIGPSGSGKSTFLRCLNLLEPPTSGQILFEGEDITSNKCDINKTRRKIGMVFQKFNLFPHLTVKQNIMLAPVHLKLKSPAEAEIEAVDLLKKVGLEKKINNYPNQLSGGQQQRIAIIRALAVHPEVMLFDEPTSALDPEMVGEVLNVMRELASTGMTMFVVTHEMNFAKEIATRILFINEGSIIEDKPPMEFFTQPTHCRVKEFLSKVWLSSR
ncbi:MAG: amino acid ABC transporter ATP-binding protein [Clostridia bacterium]|nr:amino acid ABC transporter ATP-binding protein [Clostridia bacterium]